LFNHVSRFTLDCYTIFILHENILFAVCKYDTLDCSAAKTVTPHGQVAVIQELKKEGISPAHDYFFLEALNSENFFAALHRSMYNPPLYFA